MPAVLCHRVYVLGQRPASSVRCGHLSVQCPRVPVHATAVQCPMRTSERPGVRCPVWASGVHPFPCPPVSDREVVEVGGGAGSAWLG
jgi:hypothetical protein